MVSCGAAKSKYRNMESKYVDKLFVIWNFAMGSRVTWQEASRER